MESLDDVFRKQRARVRARLAQADDRRAERYADLQIDTVETRRAGLPVMPGKDANGRIVPKPSLSDLDGDDA